MGNHYVPQHYLKGFTINGRLWAHDRENRRSFATQPKVVANETEMWPDDIEQFLANEIEAPAVAAIDKVRARMPLDQDDKARLARYIINLWKRVPEARRRADEQLPGVADDVQQNLHAELDVLVANGHAPSAVAEERRQQIDEIIARYRAERPNHIWQSNLAAEHQLPIVEALATMEWKFLCTDRLHYLTSDNPVFFFEHEGIGSPSSELTIPFSSSVALWATRRRSFGPEYLSARAGAVREINKRSTYNATRFVFSANNEPWILPFLCKGNWRLSRLQ